MKRRSIETYRFDWAADGGALLACDLVRSDPTSGLEAFVTWSASSRPESRRIAASMILSLFNAQVDDDTQLRLKVSELMADDFWQVSSVAQLAVQVYDASGEVCISGEAPSSVT